MTSEYSGSNIQVLEGLEAVRKRPGMYVGTTGKKGLHHLIWEIVDNSIDEAIAGFASKVQITITKDGYIDVEDDGRGIPVDIHPKTGLSTVETVLTLLHAGGKFDSTSYKVSGGLHGVGASVVNGLSEHLKVWIKRNGKMYFQEYFNGGIAKAELSVILDLENNQTTGTRIKFKPDFSIMDKNEFEFDAIIDRAKQIAYLNKSLTVIVKDERIEKEKLFYFEGGIVE